ncbi:uncharacterized protein LOC117653653 [Thrips palmi]|uniref:Uncharacterized protein LOC117653653 n=1 Tax=Thrips palmi TaxID=161013 RepID=A0A6P9ADF7_THRPL|nr:uncharacterized protein LOC117653653 [Thrips palmi]
MRKVVKRLDTTSNEVSLARCSAPGMRAILKKNVPKTEYKKLRALHFKGVKYRPSPFNSEKLKFHVCDPAMPFCLAHDFFEGIVKLVLAKILAYFIDKKKWFSLKTLNRRIISFKCKGSDAKDAPTRLKSTKKLSGNACENWNFLRLLPLIIGDLIQDTEDPMWQLFLSLKEVCEYVCAPSIAVEQTAYLKVLYQAFLVQLQKLLPECLIPKAHFGAHYADLILRFGPLIRLFTLRFESKHVFFKRVADACNNFINITKTLAHKYMYRFAYDNTSEILPDDLEYDTSKSLNLNLETLPEEMIASLPEDLNYEDFETIPKVIFHSVAYQIGDIMILDKADNALDLKIGKIAVICVDQSRVHFILQEIIAVNSLNGFYTLDQKVSGYSIKELEMLPDYYPLPVYIHENRECIVLKHSNPTMN